MTNSSPDSATQTAQLRWWSGPEQVLGEAGLRGPHGRRARGEASQLFPVRSVSGVWSSENVALRSLGAMNDGEESLVLTP